MEDFGPFKPLTLGRVPLGLTHYTHQLRAIEFQISKLVDSIDFFLPASHHRHVNLVNES